MKMEDKDGGVLWKNIEKEKNEKRIVRKKKKKDRT